MAKVAKNVNLANGLLAIVTFIATAMAALVAMGSANVSQQLKVENLTDRITRNEQKENEVHQSITATQKELTNNIRIKLEQVENKVNQIDNNSATMATDIQWLKAFLMKKGN